MENDLFPPDNETFTATAAQILSGVDYALDSHPEQMLFTRYMAKFLDFVWKPVREWLEQSQNFLETSPAVYYTALTICGLILAGIFGDLFYSLYLAVKQRQMQIKLDAESLPAESREQLFAVAQNFAAKKNYLAAIRWSLHAALLSVNHNQIQTALTNRQYLRQFARAPFAEDLRSLINLVERKWFGDEQCEETDWCMAQELTEKLFRAPNA